MPGVLLRELCLTSPGSVTPESFDLLPATRLLNDAHVARLIASTQLLSVRLAKLLVFLMLGITEANLNSPQVLNSQELTGVSHELRTVQVKYYRVVLITKGILRDKQPSEFLFPCIGAAMLWIPDRMRQLQTGGALI